MQILEIEGKLMESMTTRDKITEEVKDKSVEMAVKERDYKFNLYKKLMELRDLKVPTAIINKVAEGYLAKEVTELEILTIEIKYLKDKLENTRQNIEVLRSLLRNERELINT